MESLSRNLRSIVCHAVGANTGVERTATLTITGTAIAITQRALKGRGARSDGLLASLGRLAVATNLQISEHHESERGDT